MKLSGRDRSKIDSPVIELVPKQDLDRAQEKVRHLERERQRLEQESQRLERENQRLKEESERLRRELDAALRASKRQAAPHSRGKLKCNPKRPGRKPGARYGQRACRPVPSRVDEIVPVPLPGSCPHCGGNVEVEGCEVQYQEEIVRRTLVRRFDIAQGHCRQCKRSVQGRHPLQTSDAVGVGNVQIGPEALALAAILNKQMGLSLGHTRQTLVHGFGLTVSRGGLYRALARMAAKAEPTYQGLIEAARQSPVNGMDETGWRVGGRLQWLHVVVSAEVTVYAILPGRGYEQSVKLLGADYDGFLNHDGWAPYYRFARAFHQTCISHLLARCERMLQITPPGGAAAAFPMAVRGLLQQSLGLRDRHAAGEVSEHGLRTATGRLEGKLDRLLEVSYRNEENRRLAKHLEHERPWMFLFLHCPGLEATNNGSERAIRWMVIARKVWGGSRSWAGAHTQEVLVSVLRTCVQQGKDAFAQAVALLQAPRALILDIVPSRRGRT